MAEESIFSKELDPFKQAAGVFIGTLFMMLLFKSFEWIGVSRDNSLLPWTMSASGLLFFAILNSVMSLAYKNQSQYWLRSILAYILLVAIGSLFSYFVTGVSISEAQSFRWLYIVFTIGYVVFIAIVRLIRKIVIIAQKQDKALRGEE